MIEGKEILHLAGSSDSASEEAWYGHRVIAVSKHQGGWLAAAEYAKKERQTYKQRKTHGESAFHPVR